MDDMSKFAHVGWCWTRIDRFFALTKKPPYFNEKLHELLELNIIHRKQSQLCGVTKLGMQVLQCHSMGACRSMHNVNARMTSPIVRYCVLIFSSPFSTENWMNIAQGKKHSSCYTPSESGKNCDYEESSPHPLQTTHQLGSYHTRFRDGTICRSLADWLDEYVWRLLHGKANIASF